MLNDGTAGYELTEVLGYLLKHAHLQLRAATTKALRPFGIDPRTLGVLRVLAGHAPTSQQEVAQLLGVDRTTMVALLDTLEAQGIVSRHPQAQDRRRNVVELTASGRKVLAQAAEAQRIAEQEYLAPLSAPAVQQLRTALQAIVTQTEASIRDHCTGPSTYPKP